MATHHNIPKSPQIRDVEPYTAPIYYALFVFIQFFVLLNMSIAVVTEYYMKVKRDLDVRRSTQRTDNTLMVQSWVSVTMRRWGLNMLSIFYDGDSLGLMGWLPTGRRFRAHELSDKEAAAIAAAKTEAALKDAQKARGHVDESMPGAAGTNSSCCFNVLHFAFYVYSRIYA
jgi:hypothetical protein